MAYIAVMVLHPMRHIGSAIVAAVLSLALSSCGESEGGTQANGVSLAGEFLSSSESTFEVVPDTKVRIRFEDERISVSAGCNTMFGQFSVAESQLRVGPLASTMIGCPGALADQDQRINEFLTGGPMVSSSPDGFTLTGPDGATLVMVSREVADPDRPLTGRTWQLESITSDQAVMSALGFDSVKLTFTENTVDIVTPCATGSTSASTLDDGNLSTGTVRWVEVPEPDAELCAPDSGVIEAQEALSTVFGGTVEVASEASAVTLSGNGIAVTLRTS